MITHENGAEAFAIILLIDKEVSAMRKAGLKNSDEQDYVNFLNGIQSKLFSIMKKMEEMENA